MLAQTLAAVATLVSFAVHGNRVEFTLDHGAAELTWVSGKTFRFRRTLDGPLPPVTWDVKDPVAFQADDTPGAVRLRSKSIEVTIQKHGALVSVRRLDGEPLMSDLSEPVADEVGVTWERAMPEGVRYYGLGTSIDSGFDLRGKAVGPETIFSMASVVLGPDVPFLISTAGYGEWHPAAGPYRFDLTAADRYRIRAPRMDYFFCYGPSPKRVFEERNATRNAGAESRPPLGPTLIMDNGWGALRNDLLRATHAAFTGLALAPLFDARYYESVMGPLRDLPTRVRQLLSLAPGANLGSLEPSEFSKQLKSFFASYDTETRDKGYPLWHPLPFQFPDDPECARHADEFMLGDEMLIAPIYTAENKRSVYLPPGIWTNLETNAVEQGRRTITVETQSLPVFARNGTIVPLDSPNGMALHYFPDLAAEFFVLETAAGQWTQIHAAPAADIYRLEIESKVARAYQWAVHHVEKPSAVGFEERKYSEAESLSGLADDAWFYDAAQKRLYIKTRVAAGEDRVIHVTF